VAGGNRELYRIIGHCIPLLNTGQLTVQITTFKTFFPSFILPKNMHCEYSVMQSTYSLCDGYIIVCVSLLSTGSPVPRKIWEFLECMFYGRIAFLMQTL